MLPLLSLALALALPPDPLGKTALEDPPLFPLKDIKAGMKGTGYTVFASSRGLEPFQFEVLGVMHSFLGPGEDLIIARLVGEQIEKTGVISGMSGSPAYIDGKLVGAVGYRFGSFTKEPIAGITPIERMMTAAPLPASAAKNTSSAWGAAEPIAVPVTVSGVPAHVLDAFRPELAKRGYGNVTQGGGAAGGSAGSGKTAPMRFYAGGPISGNIIDGDMTMGAIGTVTWVKGDRFLAFGHPFMGEGRSEIPVGNAAIVTTVASDAGSWKMGQGTSTNGRLTDDRLHAIAGTMGDGGKARTVPVDIDVDLPSPRKEADAQKRYHFDVMQHETDTPLFCAIAIATALSSRIGVERGGTVDVEINAKLSNGRVLPGRFRAADVGMGFDLPVAFSVLGLLGAAVDQDFIEVKLESVTVKVKGRTQVDRARIVSVDAPKALAAGATGEVRVRIAPMFASQTAGKRYVERRYTVRVPRGLAEGNYQLVAAGPSEAMGVEREIGLVHTPATYDQYLQTLTELPPPGSISLFLVADEPGVKLDGQALVGLPASMAGLVGDGGGLSGQVIEARGVRVSRAFENGVVIGETQAKVYVHGQETK